MNNSICKEISYYANKTRDIDLALRAFWRRVDAERQEWEGVPVTDEYRKELEKEERAHPLPGMGGTEKRALGAWTKREIDAMLERGVTEVEGTPISEVVTARQQRNISTLRKRNVQKSEGHTKRVRECAEELHAWGILLTDSHRKTLEWYGIEDIPESWYQPKRTEEEKLEAARKAKREWKRRETLKQDPNRELRKEMREAMKRDDPYAPHPDPPEGKAHPNPPQGREKEE